MMRKFWPLVIIFLTLEAWAVEKNPSEDKNMLPELLPKKVAGWTVSGDGQTFNREKIFKYMDGAGDIYLAFNFRQLFVQEYVKKPAPPIVLEIYQMSSSEDAYGIFSHDTDGDEVKMGQGAIYGLGLLRFWKKNFFVRILAEKETEETKAAVMAIGRKVVGAIPGSGKKPALLAWVPATGLRKGVIPYFHKPISLNVHYYLADSNLLNLSEKTEAVLARYRMNQNRVRLLICRYPRPVEAEKGFEQFCRDFLSESTKKDTVMQVKKIERGQFVSARWMEKVLILVFEGDDRKTCEQLTQAVAKKIMEATR
jgi:hypothetical protein